MANKPNKTKTIKCLHITLHYFWLRTSFAKSPPHKKKKKGCVKHPHPKKKQTETVNFLFYGFYLSLNLSEFLNIHWLGQKRKLQRRANVPPWLPNSLGFWRIPWLTGYWTRTVHSNTSCSKQGMTLAAVTSNRLLSRTRGTLSAGLSTLVTSSPQWLEGTVAIVGLNLLQFTLTSVKKKKKLSPKLPPYV